MVANGVSLRAVQAIGGWGSLRMVERYAHVNDADLQ
jgi:site-specific recombinase XerD